MNIQQQKIIVSNHLLITVGRFKCNHLLACSFFLPFSFAQLMITFFVMIFVQKKKREENARLISNETILVILWSDWLHFLCNTFTQTIKLIVIFFFFFSSLAWIECDFLEGETNQKNLCIFLLCEIGHKERNERLVFFFS